MSPAGDAPAPVADGDDAPARSAKPRGIPLWVTVAAAVLVVVFGLVVAAATCGPLSLIVNPPMPPVYANASLIDSTQSDYGVDTWHYRTSDDACAVAAFYRAEAQLCPPPASGFCAGPRTPPTDVASLYVTHCRGRGDAWPFYWTWEVVIREVYGEGGPYTEFDLSRTMYWSTGK